MSEYLWLIPALPLAGAIINGTGALTGKLPRAVVNAIAVGVMALAFGVVVTAFLGVEHGKPLTQSLYTWIPSGILSVDAGLMVDELTGIMLLIITGVGTLIHLYSTGYMSEEPAYARFFAYLNLFIFFMILLVMGSNIVMTFVGWEGVGLCSYLLIGFWYESDENAAAGKKAFLVNRVGDLGFLMGIFLLFWTLGADATFDYAQLAQVVNADSIPAATATIIVLLLFVGATGKSAQIPLYVWLPDAMAGPTPVSALIHAATMVTAGIYMLSRLSFLVVLSPTAMFVIAVVGALTAFFAATIGLVQNDIKKVLAYSTVSQLGYMFLAVGLGAFHIAIFHLMTHAFFKACLFLGSGSVIHACHHNEDPQDMRQMGGLKKSMPITYWTYLLSTLAIAGVVGFSGFFSKDEILAKAWAADPSIIPPGWNMALWVIGTTGAVLTTFYMFRSVFMTFHGEFRGDPHTKENLHESPWTMTLPLAVLAILATVGGFINAVPLHHLVHSDFLLSFHHWLEPVLIGERSVHFAEMSGTTELGLIIGIQLLIFASITTAYVFYIKQPDVLPQKFGAIGGGHLHRLLYNKYYVDEIYDSLLIQPIIGFSTWVLYKLADRLVIDGTVNGVAKAAQGVGFGFASLQTGNVQVVVFSIIGGVAAIIAFITLS